MKKIFCTIVTLGAICLGLHSLQMNSAAAQTSKVTTTIIPLTNQAPFANTVVSATNLTSTQLSNVVTLLLTLQTNVEETIPVLDLIQSNAIVVSVAPTNGLRSLVPPFTSNPARPARPQTSLAVKIGTNTFGIDVPTLQALFVLRDNLQQALAMLQALNGTAPTPTNAPPSVSLIPPPITNLPPPVTNFSPGPLTNQLSVPLTPTGSLSPF